ncbi:MAG TPA: zinc-ribbon domain-containing protein [Xanthobacteraceae bacterium]|nr:zinc-ribbon domain-containing protein [Xanthobacteraceae bacterium]
MLIVCPNCATSYDVDVASLRPNGRKVRCVRCRTVWQAELSHAAKLMAAAEALAPVRHAVAAVAEAVAEDAAQNPQAWDPSEAQDRTADPFSGPSRGVVRRPGRSRGRRTKARLRGRFPIHRADRFRRRCGL